MREAGRATDEPKTARRVSVAEARELIGAGRGVLVDTRDREAYDGVHAEGAISAPFSEIRAGHLPQLKSTAKGQTLILYCA